MSKGAVPGIADGELEPVWVGCVITVDKHEAAVAHVAGRGEPLHVPPAIAVQVQV